MTGKQIKHKKYGQGKIIERNESHLKIQFEDDSIKSFIYPDAFENFLIFEEDKLQQQALHEILVNKVQKDHEAEARKQEYLRLEEEKKQEKKESLTRKRRVSKKNNQQTKKM